MINPDDLPTTVAGIDWRNMLDYSQKFSPVRRNITGEDVAKSALYLLSDLGSGVTGETLHVDCGYHVMGMFREAKSSSVD